MAVQLPRTVTYSQMQDVCAALGIPQGAAVREVRLVFGGDDAGMTVGVLARNHAGVFIADGDGDPLMAYGHVPISADPEVSPDASAHG
ncbi:hypothetical protein [Streptomyces sp. NPDC050988]|uniref:hypothetical protein n=1 Tax=Streptomyces sp. NPDC050988 TaxID=3365637 RepID=UPI0037A7A714